MKKGGVTSIYTEVGADPDMKSRLENLSACCLIPGIGNPINFFLTLVCASMTRCESKLIQLS